nr:immunoglobulin heavy chain junction region [Mus musculus]
CARGAVVADYW